MKLSLEKELSRHSYTCGEKGGKYYFLANNDGVDIYSIKENSFLYSFINFQEILELFVSFDERFLIGFNRNQDLLCFDLNKKEHVSTLTNFASNYGNVLSITTSINSNDLFILYLDKEDKNISKLIRLSLPSFSLISTFNCKNKPLSIKKSDIFKHYYLISNNNIDYYDLNFSFLGNIFINSEIINIKNCFSLDNPKRLFVQDFKKVYLLNSKYELYDEFSLINNNKFIEKFSKPEDILKLNVDEDLNLIIESELCYSTGIYKDKYLVSLSNNILFEKLRFKLFDFSSTELLINLRILSNITTILLLPNYLLISGNNGTYLFTEEEKSELVVSNPNISSLVIFHKERLINEIIRNTT